MISVDITNLFHQVIIAILIIIILYLGWKIKSLYKNFLFYLLKRKGKKGEQGRTFTSTNKYAHPIFDGDGIRVDAKGRKVFRKYHAKYNLFHIKQTEPMEVVEMV